MFDKRIIDEISNSKGYSIALLTTFNFEIGYFERTILNSLYDRDIRNVEIFVDAGELEKAVQESINNNLNKKYIANPINIQSSFHPKVVLLLGEDKAKLIVSSANIKTSGYTLNNEVYNVFEYNKDNQDNINLINDAISFFEKLNEMAYYQDKRIFNMINNYVYRYKKSENNDIKLIQNLETSVLEQLKNIITDKVTSIDIAVPYYDNELLGYRDLLSTFECGNVSLYIQNEKSTFPVEFNASNNIVKEQNIHTFLKLISNGKSNFYHGKVFRINTDKKSYILYGSSNCTLSALSKTYKNGGNIEYNILEEGQKKDFDYFFNNFDVQKFDEIKCNILEYEPKEKKQYSFKYGIRRDTIDLYISCKSQDDIKVCIGEKQLDYEYIDKDLLVKIDASIADQINNIFDISIEFKNKTEILRCWYFDIETVENYRNIEKVVSFDDISVDENMDKYLEHMELIVRTLALTTDELSEQLKLQKLFSKKSVSSKEYETDDNEIDDDFIIDKEIPDEYIKKNKDFTNAYIKSKLFADRFFRGLRIKGSESSRSTRNISNTEVRREAKKRPATPSEERFERFLKNRVKGILRKEYVELVDYEHYKNNIGVILDVINEYKYIERVEDIFDEHYIIDTSLQLINNLLDKEDVNHSDEDKGSTIILSLIIVLENHIINNSEENKDYRVELQNKDIIKRLNQLFNIRENFDDLLEFSVNYIYCNVRDLDYDYARTYIESLFGYKTKTQLLEIIRDRFDKNADINTDDENVTIKFSTNEISKYFKLEPLAIKEIKNYYSNNNLILNCIRIEIINIKDDYSDTANPIIKILYEINKNGLYTKTMIYKNGNVVTSSQDRL